MTIKFNNVYLKEVSAVAGLDEKEGNFGKLYDKTYDDYYLGEKTFEQAEIKMINDSVNILLNKANMKMDDIDVILGADLLNQITPNSYASVLFNRPFMGVYNACASVCEEIIMASSLLQNKNINNVICNTSCHNMTAERQYRNPVEYGCPKPKRSTFTVTGCASNILSKEKSSIKVTSASIGTTTDLGVTDVYDMGSVMAPSAARVIFEHLTDTKTKVSDYDLILTGDLGVYGNYLATHYFKMQGYDVLNEVGVYDNGNLLTRADIFFIDSNGIRNYCEVKAAFQIIDNIRNYKDNSLEKTGYYKNLDAEIIKYKKIGEKLIKQVKKLSKDGSLVNVIIFDGCYMDEIIKQELKDLDANIITLNVNIYDLEENIKKNVLRILSYFSKNVTINIDCKGKKNR